MLVPIDLSLDLFSPLKHRVPLFTVKQLDSIELELSLTNKGNPIDLSNQTITIYGLREDGERPKQLVTNPKFTLSNSFTSIKGEVKIEVELVDSEGTLTTATYFFTVSPRLRTENSFEAITVEYLRGENNKAEKHLEDYKVTVQEAMSQHEKLIEELVKSNTMLLNIIEATGIADITKVDLEATYKGVQEFINTYDPLVEFPELKKDIDYIKTKPVVIPVY